MMEFLCEVKDLKKYFPADTDIFGRATQFVRAVDGVSLGILRGETLGLVGESGCGKTTIGRMLVNLEQPTGGQVFFEGINLSTLNRKAQRSYCKKIQIVFQDPYASLNPRMTIGDTIAEPMRVNKLANGAELERRVLHLLDCVGLASYHRNRFPHEFSGGQRQRVGIARALAVDPQLIVCDEPVSALDVSIQAQVLNLLKDLQNEFHLTYLFIAHGLNVIRHISDRVGVMYLGKLMELSDGEGLYSQPRHPYTQALLSAIPIPDPTRRKEKVLLTGDVPSPINPPLGCRFHTRCNRCMDVCRSVEPQAVEVEPGHTVWCHLYK